MPPDSPPSLLGVSRVGNIDGIIGVAGGYDFITLCGLVDVEEWWFTMDVTIDNNRPFMSDTERTLAAEIEVYRLDYSIDLDDWSRSGLLAGDSFSATYDDVPYQNLVERDAKLEPGDLSGAKWIEIVSTVEYDGDDYRILDQPGTAPFATIIEMLSARASVDCTAPHESPHEVPAVPANFPGFGAWCDLNEASSRPCLPRLLAHHYGNRDRGSHIHDR